MYRFLKRTILFIVGVTMPIAGFSTSIAGIPTTPAKIATFLLFVLVGMQFALTDQRRMPRDRGLVPLMIFLVSLAISSVVSVAQGMTLATIILASTRYVGLALFYVVLLYVIRTREDIALLFWALVIGGAVTGFPGLIEIREGSFLATGQRTEGLAGKSNKLGYELAICIPLAFALYFTTKSLLRKAILLGSVAVMFIAIIGSLSRSTFLAIGMMWAFWIWRSRRVDTLRYMIPGLAVAAALFFVMPSQVYDRIDTMLSPSRRDEDRSINSRFLQTVWGVRAFLSNPIVGVGVNNYVYWVQRQPGGAMLHNSLHSGFMNVLATQGLLGFVPFALVIAFAWMDYGLAQRLVRSRRSRGDPALRELGTLALFLQVALLGALMGALVHPSDDSKGWWMLLSLSATSVALVRQRIAELEGAAGVDTDDTAMSTGFDYRPGVAPAAR